MKESQSYLETLRYISSKRIFSKLENESKRDEEPVYVFGQYGMIRVR